jgi:hypothetical protein
MNIDLSGIVAIIALGFSIYTYWRQNQSNKKQEALIESQHKLNELLASKETSEMAAAKSADLGAAFQKLGRSQYRLKIFNKGPATARNVRIAFPDGNEFIPDHDLEGKFPMESMDKYQAVELIAAIHMSSPSKLKVQLNWVDEDNAEREKIIHATW